MNVSATSTQEAVANVPLQNLHSNNASASTSQHGNMSDGENATRPSTDALPPTDRGKGAYTALACCTIAQAPIWGYACSFGIFQEYYTNLDSLNASAGEVATIGACQQGIIYLMMPITFLVLTRYPYLRAYCWPLGLVLSVVSLVASAYIVTIGSLIALQGVLYAIACALLFSPISIYMNEWFIEKKGLSHGIMWAGKATVGVAGPFFFDTLLNRFGYKTALLSWAIGSAVMMVPIMFFLKPRLPVARTVRGRPVSYTFLRHASFWMILSGIVLQAVGYLMPATYLASYAISIGHSSITAPILLALLHLSSVPGAVVIGMLGDQFGASMVVLLSSLGATLPVFLLWGLSFHLASLVTFVVLYGFFAGSFSSTWSSIMTDLGRGRDANDTSIIFGFLLGGRGLGFVLAGPISGALLSSSGKWSEEAIGYATKYGPMIIFTGLTAVLGGWPPIWNGAIKAVKKVKFQCTG